MSRRCRYGVSILTVQHAMPKRVFTCHVRQVCSLVMSGIGALAGCVFGALGSDPNDWPGDWPGADEVKELLTLAVVSAIANALGLAC